MRSLKEKLFSFIRPGHFLRSKDKEDDGKRVYEHFRLIAENTDDLISIIEEANESYIYTSPSYNKVLGYTKEDLKNIKPLDLIHPEDKGKPNHEGKPAKFRVQKSDGSWVWVEGRSYRVTSGQKKHIISIGRDISERLTQEEKLKQSEEHFVKLADAMPQIVWTAGPDGFMDYYNKRWFEYTGMGFEAIKNSSFQANILHPDDAELCLIKWREAVKNGESYEMEYRFKRAEDGAYRWHLGRALPIKNAEGKIIKWIGTSTDIHDQKEAQQTIRHQATHDSLTKLPNRKAIHEKLTAALDNAKQKKNRLAVMFLDLDRFKNINDRLGHLFGDKMLENISDRLKTAIGTGNTIGRLGGDEFIILVPEIKNVQEAINKAENIQIALEPVFRVDNNAIHVNSSIGISIYPDDGEDPQTLLRNADLALYRAKELGRNRYELFNRKLNLKAKQRLLLEGELRDALKNGEFEIYYQPIVETSSRTIVGAECLIRWNHPTLGLMYPNEFLGIAEETGTMNSLCDWILKTACEQNKIWQDSGFYNHTISINLSSQQFSHPKFLLGVSQALMKSSLDPKSLDVEITEGLAMENIEETKMKLTELKKLGVHVTIDDFGTGYSSLSYLKRFPVTKLKIDKSFVRHCVKNSQDATIIKAIISLAHTLNLKVIGEGVESEEELRFLKENDCEYVQGYYLSHPLPREEYTYLLLSTIKEKV